MIRPIPHRAKLDLRRLDPDQADLFPEGKEAAIKRLEKLTAEIADLQEKFYAARSH